jgi:hypothetical protein
MRIGISLAVMLMCAAGAAMCSGCAGPLREAVLTVYDAETKRPVEGADVHASLRVTAYRFGAHILPTFQEGKTDDSGEWRFMYEDHARLWGICNAIADGYERGSVEVTQDSFKPEARVVIYLEESKD